MKTSGREFVNPLDLDLAESTSDGYRIEESMQRTSPQPQLPHQPATNSQDLTTVIQHPEPQCYRLNTLLRHEERFDTTIVGKAHCFEEIALWHQDQPDYAKGSAFVGHVLQLHWQ